MISEKLLNLAEVCEEKCKEIYKKIDKVALSNTERVLSAFNAYRVSEQMFSGTTGYGYGDIGRDTLDKIFAQVFGGQDGLARGSFLNGTHAITCMLFGVMRPGKTLLSVTGSPYETVAAAIGLGKETIGTLKEYGIHYKQVDLKDGKIDIEKVGSELQKDNTISTVFVQRSRGYELRPAISCDQIEKLRNAVGNDVIIAVDNCYGEFAEEKEPCHVGADIIAGSLIKNPGGGLAPCGGYIVGKKDLVAASAIRLSSPAIGAKVGASLGINRALYQGFFIAPTVVAAAMKTAVLAAALLSELGYEVYPKYDEERFDIIQAIRLGTAEKVIRFAEGVQSATAVDSFVKPEPWAMPGYESDVIMAAGTFISGASIELSADAPMREPYVIYVQGGITYESGKIGILRAVEKILAE